MVRHRSKPSSKQTYSIAHSAHCKLNMSASEADRNLRFVLGHAFTLDKALLRVAEIEEMDEIEPQMAKDAFQNHPDDTRQPDSNEQQIGRTGSLARGKVTFDDDHQGSAKKTSIQVKKRDKTFPKPSTPITSNTAKAAGTGNTEEEDFEVVDEATLDDDGLGLTRFASASVEPPRMIPLGENDSDEDDGDDLDPKSPPSLPSGFDVHAVIDGPADAELGEMYELVSKCPCHGKQCDKSKGIWEVKDASVVGTGRRLAIMEVQT